METAEGKIDWDFGRNGRSDGFDLWRLQAFVETNPDLYAEFENENALSQAFEQAIRSGYIKKDPEDDTGHLYYRSVDIVIS